MPKTPLGDVVILPAENEASLWRPEPTSQYVVKRVKVPAPRSTWDNAGADVIEKSFQS